jgi:xanthine dehydrogenase large subunit
MSASGIANMHESARLHVTGQAHYTDDVPELRGTLHCAAVLSEHAHGKLLNIDSSLALAMPGVVAIITAADIPGENAIGPIMQDEALLPSTTLQYRGQPVAIVVASSAKLARIAARAVRMNVEPLPAIVTIEQALEAQARVLKVRELTRGEPRQQLDSATHRLQGRWTLGGQEHFYLEGMVAYAMPQPEGCMRVLSSTQHPTEVQHMVAHALGVSQTQVQVETRRIGGGFGGKESQSSHVAAWAALAAHKTGKPCKLRLDRDDDFVITGKRHDFLADYDVGFDAHGRLTALDVMLASRCGFSADLSGPVNDRAMFHIDNCYWLPHVRVVSHRCRTNTQSATAFRGFGGPQGMAVIEQVIDDVARFLGKDPLEVRQVNLYGKTSNNITPYLMTIEDNIAPELIERLARNANYRTRREAIKAFNQKSRFIKRGISLTPLKFGISFTATHLNQAGALVSVYADGSVLINHGGIEMGQGLHTKVMQLVADALGVPYASVRISATDTSKVPNTSATAASSGTDLNGKAAQAAALQIRERLCQLVASKEACALEQVSIADGWVVSPKGSQAFADVVAQAYMARLQLWSDGFYATPKIHYNMQTMTGRPFYYFSYGAAVSEVALDTLTGETRVLAVDILHDVGRSINPALDRGQIEGGFIQGMGWLTTEQLVWVEQGKGLGSLSTHAPSTYKIPVASDMPDHFAIEFWPESNREDAVFKSKAVGEPPLMLALSVWHAIKDAVLATNPQANLQAPATAPEVLRALTEDF